MHFAVSQPCVHEGVECKHRAPLKSAPYLSIVRLVCAKVLLQAAGAQVGGKGGEGQGQGRAGLTPNVGSGGGSIAISLES